jgi:hypothetical protein
MSPAGNLIVIIIVSKLELCRGKENNKLSHAQHSFPQLPDHLPLLLSFSYSVNPYSLTLNYRVLSVSSSLEQRV